MLILYVALVLEILKSVFFLLFKETVCSKPRHLDYGVKSLILPLIFGAIILSKLFIPSKALISSVKFGCMLGWRSGSALGVHDFPEDWSLVSRTHTRLYNHL